MKSLHIHNLGSPYPQLGPLIRLQKNLASPWPADLREELGSWCDVPTKLGVETETW